MQRIFKVSAIVGDEATDTPVTRTVCVAGVTDVHAARKHAINATREHLVSRGALPETVTVFHAELIWPNVDLNVSVAK